MLPKFISSNVAACLIATASFGLSATASAHGVHAETAKPKTTNHSHVLPSESEIRDVRSLTAAFRQTGEDAHLDSAWRIVSERLADTRRVGDLVDAAFVAQARHQFDAALALLDEALAVRPDLDQAWLLRSSVLLVRGDIDGAAAACRNLKDTSPVIIAACHARTATEPADAAKEADRLDRLLRVVKDRSDSPEITAWLQSVAADLDVTSGNRDRAEKRFRDSLALAENVQVRAALADLLIEADQNEEAARVLDAGATALPLVVRRMIVAKRLNETQRFAEKISTADREFQVWIIREDWLHAREMARFYLDVVEKPELARQLAKINLELQREREDLKLAARTSVRRF